jgi:hypothetical protein
MSAEPEALAMPNTIKARCTLALVALLALSGCVAYVPDAPGGYVGVPIIVAPGGGYYGGYYGGYRGGYHGWRR